MIDVTKTVREITYNGTIIPLLGSGDNPIKVSTDAEMESYLRDDKYLGVYIKFIGDSSSKYLKDQVYCVAKEGVNSKFYLLESLTNPASSAEVLEGFECYDDEGKKLVGKRESERLLKQIIYAEMYNRIGMAPSRNGGIVIRNPESGKPEEFGGY